MWKRLIEWLFGAKLPCGHGKRVRMRSGRRTSCPVCGNGYFLARFICNKPRASGTLVYFNEIE